MAETASMPRSGPTHFERLGVSRRFALDVQEVERNYLARSRETHPDFHQTASGDAQRTSVRESASLNDAYAVLREPFRRAEYLLQLEGGPSAAEHKEMAPAFLEEMLDLRMEIEELRDASDRDAPALAAMERQLVQRREILRAELSDQFTRLEVSPDGAKRTQVLSTIRESLNAAKYVQGLLRDLQAD